MSETQHFPIYVHLQDAVRYIGEGGFALRVACQLNYVFGMLIRSFTYKPRGFMPGTYGNK